MPDIFKILTNIKNIDRIAILVKVLNMKSVKDFIIFQNTENQLRLGLDAKGEPLGFLKSFVYASEKISSGGKAPIFRMDFHLDGNYYKTYTVEVLNDGSFIIDSDTVKPDRDLRDSAENPNEIEGLMDKNFNNVIDFMQPIYMSEFEKEIYK